MTVALTAWREVARRPGLVALAADGASLILEVPRGGPRDPELRDAIARLAPQVVFAAPVIRGDFVERTARLGDDRVVIGCFARGAVTIAYLLTSRVPVEIDDLIAAHAGDPRSPFDHLVD